jgi:carbon monoxide dehydrogenase subunit G
VAIQIQERFQVQAPPERVWSYLTDPAQVVRCLPGAELVEAQDERTFVGRVKVKIGPVTATYRGKAQFVELDAGARRVRMVGEGQETGGSGSAKMTMSSEVATLPDGTSEVRVVVEMEVVGRLVQFGRGMIEEVSRQLFRQFAACMQSTLGGETAAAAAAVSPAARAPALPATSATAPAPAVQPVNALQLLLRAIIEWSRRVFHLQRKA